VPVRTASVCHVVGSVLNDLHFLLTPSGCSTANKHKQSSPYNAALPSLPPCIVRGLLGVEPDTSLT
jgi:hypothetical protein